MFGYRNSKGILQWSVEQCLIKSTLHVSAIEITETHKYDLTKGRKIQLDKMDKPTAKKITSIENFNALLQQVIALRTQKSTNQNLNSSRSHLMFSFTMEGTSKNAIAFVDLAGFESPRDKENIRETQFINKSLFELNQVLASVSKKTVPNFNANPLTMLLKPFLNSTSLNLMLYHISKDSIHTGLEYIKDIVATQKDFKRKRPISGEINSKIPKLSAIRY